MKTIIYKIYCKDEKIKECYIGRTENFKSRFSQHRGTCNGKFITYHNGITIEGVYKKRSKLYNFIRINGGGLITGLWNLSKNIYVKTMMRQLTGNGDGLKKRGRL